MDKIVLKQKSSAYLIAGDIFESVCAALAVWLAWPNRYAAVLALCAAAAWLIYRLRNDGRTVTLTRTQLRRQRRYGRAQMLPLSDYSGVGVAVTRVGTYHLASVAQVALIPRNKLAKAAVVWETACRDDMKSPIASPEAETLAQQIAAFAGLENHSILGRLTSDGDWYYLAHRRPGSPDLFGGYHGS